MNDRATAEDLTADSTAAPRPPSDPGALRGEVWLQLQTRQAQRLLAGRRAGEGKAPIIGLLGFADRLRLVWQAARADDPYADWWLLKVERALAQSATELTVARSAIDALLVASEGLTVTVAASVKPARVKLLFANPYAYRGAQLLAAYDGFARRVLSAQHVGLLNRDEAERRLHLGAKPLRRAFGSVLDYRFLGITRSDVLQQTAKGQGAAAAMGELPPEILSGALRAELAPGPLAARRLELPVPEVTPLASLP